MSINKFYKNITLTFLIAFLSLFVGLYIIYSLIRLIPGDPVAAYLAAIGVHNPTEELYQQMAKKLGIYDFLSFLRAFFTGNWRISVSLVVGAPVTDLIREAILDMLELIAIPLIMGVGLGVFLGRVSSRHRGTRKDKIIQIFSIFGISLPVFFLSMVLKYFLCYELGICEPSGLSAIPIVVLTLSISALVTWEIRSYRIKKLRNRSLVSNTLLIGSIFGFIFMFYILIENVFDLTGLGYLLIQSLWVYDYFLLVGCLFEILIIFVILIFISNLLFSYSNNQRSEISETNLEPKYNNNLRNEESGNEKTFKEDLKGFLFKRLKSPIFILGAIFVFFFIFISIFPQLIATQSFNEAQLPQAGQWNPPSSEYPLGQTIDGGDVLSRTIWGIRDALFLGFLAVLISLIGGGFLGYLVGIFKSWGHKIIMGPMIFFYIFPGLILSLLFIIVFGPIPNSGLNIIAILLIPNFTQAIAKAIPGKIDVKRLIKTIIHQIPLNLGFAILIYTSIGFLGFFYLPGIRLGTDIRLGGLFLSGAPWASLWPGLAVFGLIFSFFLLHVGLKGREIKLRQVKNSESE